MLGRNKKVAQKLDTQVINLEAMKQVASFEKQTKKQKNIALLLLFLGLFMIVMGVLYPIILDTVSGGTDDTSSTENINGKDSVATNGNQTSTISTLVCTQTDEGTDNVKTIKDEYEFSSSGLVQFKTTTTILAKTEIGREKINQSTITFSTLYGNVEAAGVSKNVNVAADNSTLTTVFSLDYRQFDLTEYNKLHADNPVFVTYQMNTKKSEIKKAMTAQGVSCE